MSVGVRKAVIGDLEQIADLLQELLGEPVAERKSHFENALASNNYIPLVAEVEGKIAGFLDIWYFPDVGHGATLGLIVNFIVADNFRREGIGSMLLSESIKIAKEKRFHELHVWTGFQNKDAISVYKKHGFTNESLLLEKAMD